MLAHRPQSSANAKRMLGRLGVSAETGDCCNPSHKTSVGRVRQIRAYRVIMVSRASLLKETLHLNRRATRLESQPANFPTSCRTESSFVWPHSHGKVIGFKVTGCGVGEEAMKLCCVCSMFSLLVVAQIGNAAKYLVQDGVGRAEIVVAEEAPRTTHVAAWELQRSIRKISGAELPILNEPSDSENVKIYIG